LTIGIASQKFPSWKGAVWSEELAQTSEGLVELEGKRNPGARKIKLTVAVVVIFSMGKWRGSLKTPRDGG